MFVLVPETIGRENKKSEKAAFIFVFLLCFLTKTAVLIKETEAHVIIGLLRLFLLLLFLLLLLCCRGKTERVWLTAYKMQATQTSLCRQSLGHFWLFAHMAKNQRLACWCHCIQTELQELSTIKPSFLEAQFNHESVISFTSSLSISF